MTTINGVSMSLKDYLLLPGYTDEHCAMANVSLKTKLCMKNNDYLYLEIPFISAAMQAVTGIQMAIALAQFGGTGVIPVSQGIEEQCMKVEQVKRYKAGFQTNLITFSGNDTIKNLIQVIQKTGYTIFPVTDTGVFHGKLTGIITDKDFDPRYDQELHIRDRMRTDIQYGTEITDLKEANKIMIRYGRGFLPVVSREGTLQSVVFKHDLDKHILHPEALVDEKKRLCIGAAITTHPEDRERAKELVKNQVDFLLIDASHGHSVYQAEMLTWLKQEFSVPVIAGNVVTKEGFLMLAELGADAVKIGMGIGSGCITQNVKATGRGQATAIMEIAAARDDFAQKRHYIPLIADGSINTTADIAIALALGADTVMMGNFFARFTEGNSRIIRTRRGKIYKEYWMEGSKRAHNNRRYNSNRDTFFEEGISGYVSYLGSLYDYLPEYKNKIKSALSTAGVSTIDELHKKAVLESISYGAKVDRHVHNMTSRRM
ncbi:MAG: IMP dehydrogenase [Spirochaetales bacterium]|nr:IMP dehydrogenase [Spirochaetales bacterium]